MAIGVMVGLAILVGLAWFLRQSLQHKKAATGQALLMATELGDFDQIRVILTRPVEINARNAQGWTPLHIAAAGGNVAIVELLLEHGADVNAQSYIGATPLDSAITYGHKKEVADVLITHGGSGNTDWDALF